MRSFLERYGIAIFVLVIIGIMVLLANPVANKIEGNVNEEILKFTDKSSEVVTTSLTKDNTFYVMTLKDLREAVTQDKPIVFCNDIIIDDNDELINAFPGYAKPYPTGVQIKRDVSIDFNGYDFKYEGTNSLYYLIQVTDEATVNIYGNNDSILSSVDPDGTNIIAANRNSVVNIYGCTFNNMDPAIIDLNSGAITNIYGGFYSIKSYTGHGNQTNVLLNCTNNSNGGKFNVYGGTFVNADPRAAQDGNFVSNDYQVLINTKTNGEIWYTVSEK